ncbi:hypothetical protein FA13DRAFT_1729438 [Coprinellus micaceus]|uniref:Uncharacterized protein n=1 Tax=Coprinellus micaceus TaxID=71717 RepID=A0A4Y7TLD8_COPMI|nr:hypothetical protein FA13DRAFT_1729438 [Coprinellus micaceus]
MLSVLRSRLLPALEYPITREFGSPGVTAVAYTLGFSTIVILCLVNVALVGYEPTTLFQSNFNATQHFWYHSFVPSFASHQAGKKCDAHVFNVGDSLVTNASIFEWRLDRVGHPNAADSGFSYKGENLDNCDVVQVAIYGDIRTWSIETNLYIYCSPPGERFGEGDWDIVGLANFGLSGLPARHTNFQRLAKSARQNSAISVIGELLALAAIDIGSQVWAAYEASAFTGTVAYSIVGDFEYCPPSWIRSNTNSCTTTSKQPYPISFSSVSLILANNTILPELTDASLPNISLDKALEVPTINFVQLARAAALIDIGSKASNNLLTNLDFIDQILYPELPPVSGTTAAPSARSQLYDAWKTQTSPLNSIHYPSLAVSGPSTLQAVFICHFSKLKGIGSLIVSVLVATLSMFSSAWGLALILAAYAAKSKGRQANYCDGHQDCGGRNPEGHDMQARDEGEGLFAGASDKWDEEAVQLKADAKPSPGPEGPLR